MTIRKIWKALCGIVPALSLASTYTVKAGDTFVAIAHKLKIPVADLKKANTQLSSTHALKPGMELAIPVSGELLATNDTAQILKRRQHFKLGDRIQTVPRGSVAKLDDVAPLAGELLSKKSYKIQTTKSGSFYTYQKGDWDWTVAKRLGTSLKELRLANPNLNWQHLKVGDKLNVPADAHPLVAAKQTAKPRITSRYVLVDGSRVAVRKGASTTSGKWSVVDAGAHAKVLDRQGDWYKLCFDSGMTGWVRGGFLKATASHGNIMVARRNSNSHEAPKRYAMRYIPKPQEVDDEEDDATPVVTHHKKATKVSKHHSAVKLSRVASNSKHHASKRKLSTAEEDSDAFKNAEASIASADDSSDEKSESNSGIIKSAKRMQGVRYVYGGMSSRGTDCSGFTSQVFARNGIRLPRTAQEQSGKGKAVSKSELKPGDLVFFHTVRNRRVGHVGIYVGNGNFIHASSGAHKVKISPLTGYFARHYVGARRIK